MNKVQVYGRVSQKSEIRKTGNGTPVINISVATGYGDKVTFIPITVWSKQADIVQAYVNKGDRLLVEGHITANKLTKNDIEFTDHKVTADFVHLVETKKDKQTEATPEDFRTNAEKAVDAVVESDLPF